MAPTERRRWDTDDRFRGVRDASVASSDIERLWSLTNERGWVSEDAEAHLGQRCRTAAQALDLELVRLQVIDDILEIDVRVPADAGAVERRASAFALIGAFAEPSTHVRSAEQGPSGSMDLLVVTGVLPGDSSFATHGHLARIRVLAHR